MCWAPPAFFDTEPWRLLPSLEMSATAERVNLCPRMRSLETSRNKLFGGYAEESGRPNCGSSWTRPGVARRLRCNTTSAADAAADAVTPDALRLPTGKLRTDPASQREMGRYLRDGIRAAQLRVVLDEERGRLTPPAVKRLAQRKLPTLE